jgi:3-phenylpropionate/trans-cinnamate dioxygenase ferredoxin subunit
MPQRHRVATVGDIPPGEMKGVLAGMKPVLLANIKGRIYAIGDLCPHLYIPLSRGRLNGSVVTCPAHGSKFDVCTGEVVEWVTEKYPLGAEALLKLKARKRAITYKVEIVGKDVFVEV